MTTDQRQLPSREELKQKAKDFINSVNWAEYKDKSETYLMADFAIRLFGNTEQGKCETGCKTFTGGEVYHHKDCVFYPNSMSERLDKLTNTEQEKELISINTDADYSVQPKTEEEIEIFCDDWYFKNCRIKNIKERMYFILIDFQRFLFATVKPKQSVTDCNQLKEELDPCSPNANHITSAVASAILSQSEQKPIDYNQPEINNCITCNGTGNVPGKSNSIKISEPCPSCSLQSKIKPEIRYPEYVRKMKKLGQSERAYYKGCNDTIDEIKKLNKREDV